ncbi:MAG: glycosyltransferase family 4 protein [Candidatus Acidiferrales bacterium]
MIVGLFPDFFAVGGVQKASRQLAAVIAAFARDHNFKYRFLSLNDPQGRYSIHVDAESFEFRGFGRTRVKFLSSLMYLAIRKPRIILAAHPHLAVPAAALKRLAPEACMIVVAHGVEVWEPLAPRRKRSLLRADRILAPSRDTLRKLAEVQDVRADLLRLLPWALDPDFARLAQLAENIPRPAQLPTGRIILSVGRWESRERYKGLDQLIAALAQLGMDYDDVSVVAIGPGDDRARLQTLSAELGVSERVLFLSGRTAEELAAWYQRADVFALPSGGEGFGLVFLEAMALGKPVIGCTVGGTPDVVENGVTGLLVPYGDVEKLREALAALLSNETLRVEMGLQARRRVQEFFSFERFSKCFREILQECLVSGRGEL